MRNTRLQIVQTVIFISFLIVALITSCLPQNADVPTVTATIEPAVTVPSHVTIAPIETIQPEGGVLSIDKTKEGVVGSGIVTLFSSFDPNLPIESYLKEVINLSHDQAFFDFDKGEITTDTSADIYFAVSCGSGCTDAILAINGATTTFRSVDRKSEPRYAGCLKILQEGRILNSGIGTAPGEYSCLQTNAGNIVQILMIGNEAYSVNSKIIFEYYFWDSSQIQ